MSTKMSPKEAGAMGAAEREGNASDVALTEIPTLSTIPTELIIEIIRLLLDIGTEPVARLMRTKRLFYFTGLPILLRELYGSFSGILETRSSNTV